MPQFDRDNINELCRPKYSHPGDQKLHYSPSNPLGTFQRWAGSKSGVDCGSGIRVVLCRAQQHLLIHRPLMPTRY